ncbi:MAG: methyltransferase domain-containing protein [Oscillospiraceae bacterium]|nr:methyltransferase domain-containing protein [Oscillospiraceae bacterium]
MIDFWSTFAKFYDVAEALNGEVYREMLSLTRVMIPRGAAVLDCAAGTGALSIAAAERAGSVLCTDTSEKMLEVARKKCRRRRLDNVSFEKRNIFHLEDEDNTYDIVIAGNVLHLLVNPENAVKEMCRVVKPGGKLLLPTFVLKDKNSLSEKLIDIYKKLGFSPARDYSPNSYVEMLKGCNAGKVKARLIKGTVPCCYAVISVDKV